MFIRKRKENNKAVYNIEVFLLIFLSIILLLLIIFQISSMIQEIKKYNEVIKNLGNSSSLSQVKDEFVKYLIREILLFLGKIVGVLLCIFYAYRSSKRK